MTYTTQTLVNKLGSFFKLNQAVKKGLYFKVSHGIYSDKPAKLSEIENIFMRLPNAVLTLQSAFYFYGMTDTIPDKYYVATSQKAHSIKDAKIKQIYMTDKILDLGKETYETKYGTINVYDKERLLIELFRFKKKLPFALFKEVVQSYRQLVREDQLDLIKVLNYCSRFSNGEHLRDRIQEVVL